jgi:hypothetical protein
MSTSAISKILSVTDAFVSEFQPDPGKHRDGRLRTCPKPT